MGEERKLCYVDENGMYVVEFKTTWVLPYLMVKEGKHKKIVCVILFHQHLIKEERSTHKISNVNVQSKVCIIMFVGESFWVGLSLKGDTSLNYQLWQL